MTEAFWVHDFVCNSKKRACIKNTKLSMRGKLRNQNALRMWKAWHNCLLNFSRLWPPSRTLRSIAFHTKKLTYKASVTITINCNVLDANQIVIQLYTIKVTFQVLFHSFHLLRKENKSMHLLQNQKQLWQLSFSASREKKFKWPHLKLWKRLDQGVLALIVGHSRSTSVNNRMHETRGEVAAASVSFLPQRQTASVENLKYKNEIHWWRFCHKSASIAMPNLIFGHSFF